jgi:cell division septum initiation protein DivIVA
MADARPAAWSTLDRIGSFRVVYVGILLYVLMMIATLEGATALLTLHFRSSVVEATRVTPVQGWVVPRIQAAVEEATHKSPWVRIGGVRVVALVIGADGHTPIYLEGRTVAPPPRLGFDSPFAQADTLLPAIAEVSVSIPLDSLLAGSIFVGYGAILIPWLFAYHRRSARREAELVEAAVTARDAAAERARSIQGELEKVQDRLAHLEPAERAHADEIHALQSERGSLQARLRELSERERQLREQLGHTSELERERQTLEELLDEAVEDLGQKEREIGSLEERLRRATRTPSASRRSSEQLGRRMRTLYHNLEIDDRALDDMAALGDESLRLRAEEAIKRLDADVGNVAIRRKVGGLPPGLAIFELGFAGKGRIYFCRGRQRAQRILAIGGKASQKTDLEYLSRVST